MTPELRRPLPWTWWLRKQSYLFFMIRELTSLAVLAYAILIIAALRTATGDGSFTTFFDFLKSTTSVIIHVGLLILALVHTFTWIALTPKVMVLWRDDEQIEPDVIAGANGVIFLLISGAVLWVVLG